MDTPEKKSPLETPRRRQEDNTRTDIQVVG